MYLFHFLIFLSDQSKFLIGSHGFHGLFGAFVLAWSNILRRQFDYSNNKQNKSFPTISMCLSNLLFWAAQDRAEARRAAAQAEKAAEDADNAGSAASGGMGLFGALAVAASGEAANADPSY